MDNIRPSILEEFLQLGEGRLDSEPLGQLPGHEFFSVADSHDARLRDSLNLRGMSVGDLAASHNGDFKHCPFSPGNFGRIIPALDWWTRQATNPVVS